MLTEAVMEAHTRWKAWLRPTDGAIDATAGNGKDTLLLSQLVPNGYVIGFDIQEIAIQRSRERLKERSHVTLHLRSHEEIDRIPLPFPPRLIIYNLGYLPGGNKAITNIRLSAEPLKGWTVEFKTASVDYLGPGSVQTIDLNIKPDSDIARGDYRVTIVAQANEIRKVKVVLLAITETSYSYWPWIGAILGIAVVVVFAIVFVRLNRR